MVRPTVAPRGGPWVEPSPAGTTPKESVEESDEESEERARGRREEEGTAGEGEARDVEVEVAGATEESLEPMHDEVGVGVERGTVDDRLAEGKHVAAVEVGGSETPVACPSTVLDEHAVEGTEGDAGCGTDEMLVDSEFDNASWLEPISSLCPKVVACDDT